MTEHTPNTCRTPVPSQHHKANSEPRSSGNSCSHQSRGHPLITLENTAEILTKVLFSSLKKNAPWKKDWKKNEDSQDPLQSAKLAHGQKPCFPPRGIETPAITPRSADSGQRPPRIRYKLLRVCVPQSSIFKVQEENIDTAI